MLRSFTLFCWNNNSVEMCSTVPALPPCLLHLRKRFYNPWHFVPCRSAAFLLSVEWLSSHFIQRRTPIASRLMPFRVTYILNTFRPSDLTCFYLDDAWIDLNPCLHSGRDLPTAKGNVRCFRPHIKYSFAQRVWSRQHVHCVYKQVFKCGSV